MLISLDGITSGNKPDFNIILCPRSLLKNDANPAPKPFFLYNQLNKATCLTGMFFGLT